MGRYAVVILVCLAMVAVGCGEQGAIPEGKGKEVMKPAMYVEAQRNLRSIRTMEEAYRAENDCSSTSLSAIGWEAPRGEVHYAYSIAAAASHVFTALASGDIDGDGRNDVWTINQDGTLTHSTVD